MPCVAHQDREQGETDHHRVKDVIGTDRQPLPGRFERVAAAVAVELDDLDLFRGDDSSPGPVFPDLFFAHSGSEIPCARMNRKCTYINRTIKAGSTNTRRVKKRCRVGGPTTGPPCASSRMKAPT